MFAIWHAPLYTCDDGSIVKQCCHIPSISTFSATLNGLFFKSDLFISTSCDFDFSLTSIWHLIIGKYPLMKCHLTTKQGDKEILIAFSNSSLHWVLIFPILRDPGLHRHDPFKLSWHMRCLVLFSSQQPSQSSSLEL